MKRREFLGAAGTGFAASVLAAPAIAISGDQWRCTSAFKILDTLYGAAEVLPRPWPRRPTTDSDRVFAAGGSYPGCGRVP